MEQWKKRNWVQITGILWRDGFDERNLLQRLRDYALWRWYSAVRAMKNPAKWWKRRQRVRQINRYLLAEARKYEQDRQGI
jgi:hypothetical protein